MSQHSGDGAKDQKFKAALSYLESSRPAGLENPSQEQKQSEHLEFPALSSVKCSPALVRPSVRPSVLFYIAVFIMKSSIYPEN